MGGALEETPFFSIFVSMWWVLTTITTVGFGDMVPTSVPGRICGSMAMVLGVIGFAMPISFIGTAFEEEYFRLAANTDGGDDDDDEDPVLEALALMRNEIMSALALSLGHPGWNDPLALESSIKDSVESESSSIKVHLPKGPISPVENLHSTSFETETQEIPKPSAD